MNAATAPVERLAAIEANQVELAGRLIELAGIVAQQALQIAALAALIQLLDVARAPRQIAHSSGPSLLN